MSVAMKSVASETYAHELTTAPSTIQALPSIEEHPSALVSRYSLRSRHKSVKPVMKRKDTMEMFAHLVAEEMDQKAQLREE